MKSLITIAILVYLVMITLQNEIPSSMLSIHRMSSLNDGTVFYWLPPKTEENTDIIGYKLSTWEMKKFRTHRIKDTKGIIEYQEIDHTKIQDLPDYDPVIYKIVPKGNPKLDVSAKIECLPRGVYYLTRVKTYGVDGDGPWSEALAWRDGPPIYSNAHYVNVTME